jgi:hypothetical protein
MYWCRDFAGWSAGHVFLDVADRNTTKLPDGKRAMAVRLLRLWQYVYGQKVLVESDHKPLVGLLDKPIAIC